MPRYEGPTLVWADLAGANLRGANLRGLDFRGANLTGAYLRKADLAGADLTGADLAKADLAGANLTGTLLAGADLTGARLTEGTAQGRTVGGRHGGYRWWAVRLADDQVALSYGCYRHTLDWWRRQSSELSIRNKHQASHWEEGPMVAIAAAEALLRSDR